MLNPGRLLFLVLLAATVASLVALRSWTIPALKAATGRLDVFDVLISGYSHDYVALYNDVLSDEARGLYLGAHRALDTIFAVSLTGTLSVAAFLLAQRWSLVLALALGLIPLFYFAFDMLENAQIAAILYHRVVSVEAAEAASRFSVSKAQALRFAITAVLFVVSARAFEAAFGPAGKSGGKARDRTGNGTGNKG
ncbi:MAG: hypothetical protein R3D59_00835 [Paracoccaceae bacterium]